MTTLPGPGNGPWYLGVELVVGLVGWTLPARPWTDLQRHAKLGMTAAAVELAVGDLHGLHRCRDGGSESLLEHPPDYADERAAAVVRQCHAAAVDLPLDDLAEALTGWELLFRHGTVGVMSEAGWSPAGGIEVSCVIGEPDPMIAFEREWQRGRYDEIIVSTLPRFLSRWLHTGLPRRIGHAADVPSRT